MIGLPVVCWQRIARMLPNQWPPVISGSRKIVHGLWNLEPHEAGVNENLASKLGQDEPEIPAVMDEEENW